MTTLIRKMLLTAFCAATATVSCSATAQIPVQNPLADPREQIAARDFAWIHDTLPILRLNTPWVYYGFRAQIEQCSGLRRDGWPTFWISNQNPLPGNRGAFYSSQQNAVVFALGYEVLGWAAMHEILHFLAHPVIALPPPRETEEERQARQHPDSLFAVQSGKCGHLVNPR